MKKLTILLLLSTVLFAFGEKRAAQRAFENRLKDPESIQIKGAKLFGSGAVCGFINAKNGFGAYTGWQRFVGIGDFGVLQNEVKHNDFVEIWNKACK